MSNGVDLHVESVGSAAGPPVAFIHGFMSSNLQWQPNLERLGSSLRMLLIEHPGHGKSPAPSDPAAYEAAAVIAGLERVREAQGVDRWWLVGHSMGGAIAIRYGLAHPDRINGVVFTNSRAVFGVSRTRTEARIAPNQDLRQLPYHPIHAKRFPAELQEQMVKVADAMTIETVMNVTAVVSRWRSVDELGDLLPPALLVNGRWEKAFQPCIEQATAAISSLKVVSLDGGHSINIENPEGFDAAVLDFVGSGEPAAPAGET